MKANEILINEAENVLLIKHSAHLERQLSCQDSEQMRELLRDMKEAHISNSLFRCHVVIKGLFTDKIVAQEDLGTIVTSINKFTSSYTSDLISCHLVCVSLTARTYLKCIFT